MMREPPLGTRTEAGLRKRANWWSYLEAHSDQPEFQELIRREIFNGSIRVIPGLEGRVRIIPADARTALPAEEPAELRAPLADRRARRSTAAGHALPLLRRVRL